MRSRSMALLIVPALALAACDRGEEDTVDPSATPTATPSEQQSASPDDAAASTAPGDAAGATSAAPEDVEGGEQGQAAADRAKEFLVAIVGADPAACAMMLSFSDTSRPMADLPEDLELCEEQLPEIMEPAIEAQGLGEEGQEIMQAMRITGAEVDGDLAVIDRDNYSSIFSDMMGESTITLQQVDGEWYVDVDRFLDPRE